MPYSAPACGLNFEHSSPGDFHALFFSVGEPSGDLHGANLIRALREQAPDVECVGFGGPQMAAAGCHLNADLTRLAVMWFARAIINLHKFLWLLVRADWQFRRRPPDAVVLIDYPGFNWWIARRAKKHGIPVFYYGPPQIWAWASWRIEKMRRLVDHILCKLPFEIRWYEEQGCQGVYVGHPFFDEVRRYEPDEDFLAAEREREGRLVALLPGSRTQEVTRNLPQFIKAAVEIQRRIPDVRFAVAALHERHAEMARTLVEAAPGSLDLRIEVHAGRTPELMQLAECCLAVSGSVSLELLHYAKPTAVLYNISPLGWWLQNRFRRAHYVTLVNLLAADGITRTVPATPESEAADAKSVLMPEYVAYEDRAPALAQHVCDWLEDESLRQASIRALEHLREDVDVPGASARGAEYILDQLGATKARTLRSAA